MNEKQQQLLFDKGISNIPSDTICDDNCLSVYENMTYENGEHRPIQKPKQILDGALFDQAEVFIFIHQSIGKNGYDRHIYWNEDTEALSWIDEGDDDPGDLSLLGNNYVNKPDVTAIGNILIVNSPDLGLCYFLWQPDKRAYFDITNIQKPDVSFRIINKELDPSFDPDDPSPANTWKPLMVKVDSTPYDTQSQTSEMNAKVADYTKSESACFEKTGFPHPFWIRYALKLYTGDYIYPSQPILVIPSTHHAHTYNNLQFQMQYGLVYYKNNVNYSSFKDVVSAITVFASEFVRPDDITTKRVTSGQSVNTYKLNFGGYKTDIHGTSLANTGGGLQVFDEEGYIGEGGYFERKSLTQLTSDLVNASVFYKLCDIESISIDSVYHSLPVEPVTLHNLKLQTTLDHDDFFSRAPIQKAEVADTYNQRLNIANVKRGFFNGYKSYIVSEDFATECQDPDGRKDIRLYYYIRTDSGERIVCTGGYFTNETLHYFYYPDPRAYKVEIQIYYGNTWLHYKTYNLKEHPHLNGAYYLRLQGLVNICESQVPVDQYTGEPLVNPPQVHDTAEILGNILMQSEVNNPLAFYADGYVTIGSGTIIGFASQTTALSQGQFGQYPMMVFSSEGLWALTVNDEGKYTSSRPASREVCSNRLSITQTDGAIFFASDKGLMLSVGNEVSCVSQQMGPQFIRDLQSLSVKIAYDYRDSLLWIRSTAFNGFWIYNIKSQTFSKVMNVQNVRSVVGNYPDVLLQDDGRDVYSLLQRPLEDADTTRYSGTIKTRSMKFENAMALKSILQVRNIKQLQAKFSLTIEASNNMSQWFTLTSLCGRPWKYYRFTYSLSNMLASDRFAGAVIVTQERRTDKLR